MVSSLKFLAVVGAAVLLAGCNRGPGNAQQISDACEQLRKSPTMTAVVAPEAWPPAIARLHPHQVRVEKGSVWVFLKEEPGQPATGYVYVPSVAEVPESDTIKLEPTRDPQLYRFTRRP